MRMPRTGVTLANRFIYKIILWDASHAGQIRLCEQIRVALKRPNCSLKQYYKCFGSSDDCIRSYNRDLTLLVTWFHQLSRTWTSEAHQIADHVRIRLHVCRLLGYGSGIGLRIGLTEHWLHSPNQYIIGRSTRCDRCTIIGIPQIYNMPAACGLECMKFDLTHL
jgi:hypothetical protein